VVTLAHNPPAGLLAWHIGWPEVAIIVVAILILFGGRKLPELARGIGRGMREFKRGLRGVQDELEAPDDQPADGGQPPDAGDKNRRDSSRD
jgi:sec-independent protein translocase protein TatA